MAFTFGSTPVGSIQKKPTKKKPTFAKTPTAKEKTDFRKKEQQATKTSIGTAGPKKTGDPSKDKSKPTAAQKEAFRQQEETYRTKSPGTAGDIYYKNEEGTGTGQGGSGIPKTTKKTTGSTTPKISGVVTTSTPPVSRPPDITPPSYTPPSNEDSTYVKSIDDTKNPFSLSESESSLRMPSSEDFMSSNIYRTGAGNKINLNQEILYKDWNQVNVNLVYDGLSIKGVKFNVKVPFSNKFGNPFNQKTKFTFGG